MQLTVIAAASDWPSLTGRSHSVGFPTRRTVEGFTIHPKRLNGSKGIVHRIIKQRFFPRLSKLPPWYRLNSGLFGITVSTMYGLAVQSWSRSKWLTLLSSLRWFIWGRPTLILSKAGPNSLISVELQNARAIGSQAMRRTNSSEYRSRPLKPKRFSMKSKTGGVTAPSVSIAATYCTNFFL